MPCYFALKIAALVVAVQLIPMKLRQGSLARRGENIRERVVRREPFGKPRTVHLAQGAHERVAVLVADFAILITMAAMQSGLFQHWSLSSISSQRSGRNIGTCSASRHEDGADASGDGPRERPRSPEARIIATIAAAAITQAKAGADLSGT